jgi:hypothetical protein
MLLLRVEYSGSYYSSLLSKLAKIRRRAPIHVDVFSRKGTVFVESLDDGFSASFLYAAYLKAKGRGLKADMLYARYIDENLLPEEVRKAGRKWLSEGLSEEEAELLKSHSITERVLAGGGCGNSAGA